MESQDFPKVHGDHGVLAGSQRGGEGTKSPRDVGAKTPPPAHSLFLSARSPLGHPD